MGKGTTLKSDTIKIIAMVCMTIDHIGSGIVERMYRRVTDYELSVRLYNLNLILRGIGRIAFPIFAYLLVMGFFCTRNRVKHARNLAIFALISEIPFDLADEGVFFYWGYQNVFFTLLIGTLMVWMLDLYENSEFYRERTQNKLGLIVNGSLMSAFIVLCAISALSIKADYGARGIVLIAIIYFLRNDKTKLIQLGPILFVLEIFVVTYLMEKNLHATVKYVQFEIYAVFAFMLMYIDNRGRFLGKWFKWFGYAYYALHLTVIFLTACALGLVY